MGKRATRTQRPAAPQQPEPAPLVEQEEPSRGRSKRAARRPPPEQPETPAKAGEVPEEAGTRRTKRPRAALALPEAPRCFSAHETRVHIGTSGYSYKAWHQPGSLYEGVPAKREFEVYAAQFDTVELNATFYGWFKESVFDGWRARAEAVRPSFQYVVKASNMYTHKKRLNVDDNFRASWANFWARCERLRPFLGPVLFQLPGDMAATSQGRGGAAVNNIDRLRRLGELLPRGERFVFEFRHPSWYCSEVYEVLHRHDWCLAIVDVRHGAGWDDWANALRSGPNPRVEDYPLEGCSWGVYVRYHGAKGQYQGAYGRAAMERWAGHTQRWLASGREVWHAFNNTDDGRPPSAVADCRDLAAALRAGGTF